MSDSRTPFRTKRQRREASREERRDEWLAWSARGHKHKATRWHGRTKNIYLNQKMKEKGDVSRAGAGLLEGTF